MGIHYLVPKSYSELQYSYPVLQEDTKSGIFLFSITQPSSWDGFIQIHKGFHNLIFKSCHSWIEILDPGPDLSGLLSLCPGMLIEYTMGIYAMQFYSLGVAATQLKTWTFMSGTLFTPDSGQPADSNAHFERNPKLSSLWVF